MKDFEPIAGRIFQHDQFRDMSLAGERPRSPRHLDLMPFELRSKRIEGRRVRNLPPEEANALAAIGVDDEPLLSVIHAEGKSRAALIKALQPEKVLAVAPPIIKTPGATPDVPQCLNSHVQVLNCPALSSRTDRRLREKPPVHQ